MIDTNVIPYEIIETKLLAIECTEEADHGAGIKRTC